MGIKFIHVPTEKMNIFWTYTMGEFIVSFVWIQLSLVVSFNVNNRVFIYEGALCVIRTLEKWVIASMTVECWNGSARGGSVQRNHVVSKK